MGGSAAAGSAARASDPCWRNETPTDMKDVRIDGRRAAASARGCRRAPMAGRALLKIRRSVGAKKEVLEG